MAKFSKNFKKNAHNDKLPESVLKEINKQFKNFEYVENNGVYILVQKNDIPFQFRNFEIVNPEFYKSKLKKSNLSFDEIYSYLYNSQTSLELKEKDDTFMIIDGQKKKLSDQILSKYNIVNGTGKITITPIIMNETVYFDIGSDKTNAKKIQFARRPIDSAKALKYESIDSNEKIHIKMILENHIIGIDLTLVDKNIHGAQDYLDCLKELNQLYKTFYFNNQGPICFKNKKSDSIVHLIEYFEKVIELEKILKIKFDIKQHAITVGDIQNLEILYLSLIKEKPWRLKDKLNNVRYNWIQTPDEIKDLLENKKRDFALSFEKKESITLYKMNFSLYMLYVYFNLSVSNIETISDNEKIVYFDVNNKDTYGTCIGFELENDLINFMQKEDSLSKLTEAISLTESQNI